eukprot:8590814-Pyramimonas_sp.AAC.1
MGNKEDGSGAHKGRSIDCGGHPSFCFAASADGTDCLEVSRVAHLLRADCSVVEGSNVSPLSFVCGRRQRREARIARSVHLLAGCRLFRTTDATSCRVSS